MATSQRGHHMQDSPAPGCIRFGPFELDARSGELRNGDTRQLLADQPLAILKALIERPASSSGATSCDSDSGLTVPSSVSITA